MQCWKALTEWVCKRGKRGWELGGRPDLLHESEDDELDDDSEPEDL